MMNEYRILDSDKRLVGENIKSSVNVLFDLIEESFNSLTLTISILSDSQRIIGKLIE